MSPNYMGNAADLPEGEPPMARPMFTTTFLVDMLERSLKTAAQAVLVALGLSDTGFGNAFEFDWGTAFGFGVGGFVVSVLTSVVSAPIGDNGTASVVPAPPGPGVTEL